MQQFSNVTEVNLSGFARQYNKVLYVLAPYTERAKTIIDELQKKYGGVLVNMDELIERNKSFIDDKTPYDRTIEIYTGFVNRAVADLKENQLILIGYSVVLIENGLTDPNAAMVLIDVDEIKPEIKRKSIIARHEQLVLEKDFDYLQSTLDNKNRKSLTLDKDILLDKGDRSVIDEYLRTLSDKVNNNIEIVTPVTIEQDFFLHISTNTTIPEFIPQIGDRQHELEDRTVPRVCVGVSLYDCIAGHNAVYHTFMYYASNGSEDESFYRGGFKIYALPFEYGIKPNNELVPVASTTNEHWLIAYSEETKKYIPIDAGNFFVESVTYVGTDKGVPVCNPTLYVEVKIESGFLFCNNLKLDKGYYEVKGVLNVKNSCYEWTCRDIKKEQYVSMKYNRASLLSDTPTWTGW